MLALWLAAGPGFGAGPAAVVEGLHGALAEVMGDAARLGFEGRRARLAPVLHGSFDFEAIAQIVLGPHWRGLDEAQRRRMVETFARLTVATYAARFDGDGGRRFVTLQTRDLKRGRVLVRTELRAPGETPVQLDYVLHEAPGGRRIVNVVADGVSDLALKRAEYTAEVEAHGLASLLGKLEAQIDAYARGRAD